MEALVTSSKSWWKYALLGAVLMVLGFFALGSTVGLTEVSVMFYGWLILFAGIAEGVHAFAERKNGHFMSEILRAILGVAIGVVAIRSPGVTALALTLVFSIYLIVGGLFRSFSAMFNPTPFAGWAAFSGVVSFILGMVLFTQWPVSGLWFIGAAIAVDLIMQGSAFVALGLTLKSESNLTLHRPTSNRIAS